MHIRPLEQRDIPYLSIVASAFSNDELFTVIHPRRYDHPEDFRNHLAHNLKVRSHTPGMHAFVCVSDWRDATWLPAALASSEAETIFGRLGAEGHRADNPTGEILLGYAVWTRMGPANDPTVRAWGAANTGLSARLDSTLLEWESWYVDRFRVDRSVDLALRHGFRTAVAFADSPAKMREEGSGCPGYWQLKVLAASPMARRRGVGSALMRWGMQRAEDEGVPVFLHASTVGEKLYRHLGFKVVDWAEKAERGRSMVWDPSGRWTESVDEDDERAFVVRGDAEKKLRVDVVWRL